MSTFTKAVLAESAFLVLVVGGLLLLSVLTACGRPSEGIPGEPGAQGTSGPAGPQGEAGIGANGQPGASCSVARVEEGALITCPDGTSALVKDGTPRKGGG